MSRESYIRGFCKVAVAHGVDPVQLAKFAANDSANIGTQEDNGLTRTWVQYGSDKKKYSDLKAENSDSYAAQLARGANNSPYHHAGTGLLNAFKDMPSGDITKETLEKARESQAKSYADTLVDPGAGEKIKNAVINNLIRSGKKNYSDYLKEWKVTPREAPDLKGLEGVPISLEYLRLLRTMQNSMVRNGRVGVQGNIA